MSDDQVGYRNPPKHSQFKKGQSGNPKGRPKGRRNAMTDVLDVLKAPVRVKENGRQKTVSTQHAVLLRLREKALGGDQRAINRVIDLAREYNGDDLAEHVLTLAPADQAIVDAYARRLRQRQDQEQEPTAEPTDLPRQVENETSDAVDAEEGEEPGERVAGCEGLVRTEGVEVDGWDCDLGGYDPDDEDDWPT